MPSAITPIASYTVTSAVNNYTFTSISGAYKDLLLVMNLKNAASPIQYEMQFNADATSSNYGSIHMRGIGSGSGLSSTVSGRPGIRFAVTGVFDGAALVSIMDYSATNKHKSVLAKTGDANYGIEAHMGRWASTAAITQVRIATVSSTMATGSTLTLYGISG